ncbi:ketopantoate reductase family protein [Bacillus thermotolerans]|uniref:2-dehydropantoate 2-reductase n=1 Tax=Bacillus thermotolerans TaxID=1221996 RepID=A0A0F5I0A5_BACTR|nr:ketopantoate reductase family protein [Bacillus thermotolerans]KKB34189.1 2-dehydropantoate 2-reductase [Bacillus thermotolerans]KKB39074.1 2-dehydropantoate 2-reductase [Bacillus thermotolerans]
MKILMVGAGAVGGYFGGRLLENGADVTFLVREKRRGQLEQTGLNIDSVHGNISLTPRLLTAGESNEPFDLVIISVKAYHLSGVIEDIRPHVAKGTTVLPLLNGTAHVRQLIEAFGEAAVIGGLCFIETTLDEEGTIIQKSPVHRLTYGERTRELTPRIKKLQALFDGAKASFVLSDHINRDMWHKYLFITAMSGLTSLMAAPIGPIRGMEAGQRTIEAFLQELASIMRKAGAPIEEDIIERHLRTMNEMDEEMKSSMQRDMEKLLPIEADHLQGYLLGKARKMDLSAPILETVYTKLALYERERRD